MTSEMKPEFKIVTTHDELLKAYAVRSIVFIEEQACPYALEFDEFDYTALHILGHDQGEPFAAARIRFLGEYAKLERLAIRQGYRGQRLGDALVEFMLKVARDQGFHKFKMHAQSHLIEFYRKHGFEPHSEHFDEAGIDHVLMVRDDAG